MNRLNGYMLSISNRPSKKYKIVQGGGIGRVVHFGDSSYEDYTIHKNEARKQSYLRRHEGEYESFRHQAGFWARWLLWNKPTLRESIQDVERKFNIKIFIV